MVQNWADQCHNFQLILDASLQYGVNIDNRWFSFQFCAASFSPNFTKCLKMTIRIRALEIMSAIQGLLSWLPTAHYWAVMMKMSERAMMMKHKNHFSHFYWYFFFSTRFLLHDNRNQYHITATLVPSIHSFSCSTSRDIKKNISIKRANEAD